MSHSSKNIFFDYRQTVSSPATGKPYDPIYTAAIQPNNVHLHTIFTSPNGLLTLVSVTPFWAVALKLVRYTKWDPGDICLLLRSVVACLGDHFVGGRTVQCSKLSQGT